MYSRTLSIVLNSIAGSLPFHAMTSPHQPAYPTTPGYHSSSIGMIGYRPARLAAFPASVIVVPVGHAPTVVPGKNGHFPSASTDGDHSLVPTGSMAGPSVPPAPSP